MKLYKLIEYLQKYNQQADVCIGDKYGNAFGIDEKDIDLLVAGGQIKDIMLIFKTDLSRDKESK